MLLLTLFIVSRVTIAVAAAPIGIIVALNIVVMSGFAAGTSYQLLATIDLIIIVIADAFFANIPDIT